MSGKPRPVAEERDRDGALDMSLMITSITLSGRSLGHCDHKAKLHRSRSPG